MLRTKITELGELRFLEDGGLVCLVTSDQPPSLDASPRAASLWWASPDPSNWLSDTWSPGDLVAHSDHGVARYRGRKSIDQGSAGGKKDFLVLEFADVANVYVPITRSYLVQKLRAAECAPIKLSPLNEKGAKWPQSYCLEVLPKAYEWPGLWTFPNLPQEVFSRGRTTGRTPEARAEQREAEEIAARRLPEEMAEWRRACVTYRKALHAETSYRKAAQEYLERQNREPQPLIDWWVYRAMVLRVGPNESTNIRNHDEQLLLIKQHVLRRERKVEKIRREVEALENWGSLEGAAREPIPESVRLFVWRRDKGQCVRCGSRERLEFDHIIPVVAGGSSTERNIQLLCESCNRSKSATV